jgi:hypothetical protein
MARVLIVSMRVAGYSTLGLIWLACLAGLGLYSYERWAGSPPPSAGLALALLFGVLGFAGHGMVGLWPFPWLERVVTSLWNWLRYQRWTGCQHETRVSITLGSPFPPPAPQWVLCFHCLAVLHRTVALPLPCHEDDI